ncbi:MAG: transposase, partial [Peptococcaceae bacterium]|nr:transposase [Peptococcaceae bacterium]
MDKYDPQCREGETPIDTEARLFSTCMRWAFNQLLDGRTREELKKAGQIIFGLNSRRVDDAILKAQAVIDSQRELLPQEIAETKIKLARANKKLAYAEKDLKKAYDANDGEEIARKKRTVRGRKMRVARLSRKLEVLVAHEAAGTIPKVIFGGRALWR